MSRNRKHTVGTASNTQFAHAVHADIRRSTFLRTHTHKTTINAGRMYPVLVDEVLPGDTWELNMAALSRMQTPLFPTMDTCDLDFYAFYCPTRLLWDKWEELIANTNKTGAWSPSTRPSLVPMFSQTHYPNSAMPVRSGDLGAYMGVPIGMTFQTAAGGLGQKVSVLPFRGNTLIWNEWFRDQNTQAPLPFTTGGVVDLMTEPSHVMSVPFRVNKKHDYFTSALPAPQKGESALIPVQLNKMIPVITGSTNSDTRDIRVGSPDPQLYGLRWSTNDGSPFPGVNGITRPLGAGTYLTPNGAYGATNADTSVNQSIGSEVRPRNLWADPTNLGSLSSTTISELRTAFQVQKMYERDARGGTRYVEYLKSHFGVEAEDYRLQRPEYLGSFHTQIGINQVAQTSASESGQTPQGNVAAFSHSVNSGRLFRKSFVEHGYVYVYAVARSRKTYAQGLPKMFSRRDRLDFYLPVLANISEQPIYTREIYANLSASDFDNRIFGYKEPWGEYRFSPNRVSGNFAHPDIVANPNSLNAWHYADKYDTVPTLSAEWIQDNTDVNMDRTLAVPSTQYDQIMLDLYFHNRCTRAMPTYSIPGFVDHF